MNQGGAGGGDGQAVPNVPAVPSPSLGQLKEALRVLDLTQTLFNGMKAKVMYACGEGHLMASDEGRPYLTKIIKSLDEEHRTIRASYPRLSAALEVARVVNKLAAIRGARGGGGAGTAAAAGRSATAAAEAAAAAAPAVALQAHCRSVVEQLDAAVCEEVLAAGGARLQRALKRPRTDDAPGPQTSPPGAFSSASPSSPPALAAASPLPTGTFHAAASSLPKALETAWGLLGVLLRMRALDGSPAAMSGGPAPSLGGMKIHVLDDAGMALNTSSALTGALVAAAQAAAAGSGAGAGAGAGAGQARLDPVLLNAGAARLVSATQVRMLLPGVFVANVLLEGPGNPAPLRVAIDCADKAFELNPWATPTTQVFRRISALATRVLTYYVKRAPLSAAPRAVGGTAGASVSGAAALLPPEPISPGAAALEDLLLWLLSCRDLFTKRCAATGRLMAWDPSVQYPVPPIFRAFKLPREELRLRAVDLSRVAAYHMHVTPVEQLGWAEDVPAEAEALEGEGLAGPGPGSGTGVGTTAAGGGAAAVAGQGPR
ncbi:hypothetical protein PLESTB_000914100 [Pleodorina starrii]|uniref:Uncharacterized protein n=1 Tax=Pleodorina starrii TaxID=330485 RepID=A0A9W6BMK5_9CHLO|nr:hypothetical protein PLESTM_001525100 [Pleodorina starrii]GLC54864.1 hypothetical protein PLESTB_000914100 [Pleodorina starrii]GLC73687.1 hypothetical protein PLESTF_001408400 [Pleodorina starrii]